MKRRLFFLFCVLSFAAAAADSQWLIIPGERVGPITAKTSEAELNAMYKGEVVTTKVDLGEGETATGTVLFPKDPARNLSIMWKDAASKARPQEVRINSARSIWKIQPGVGMGTTLKELEKINGRPFKIYGFEWDRGGAICSWEGGSLDASFSKKGVMLQLGLNDAEYSGPAYKKWGNSVVGDKCYLSSSPALQALNPRVGFITIEFH